MFPNGQNWSQLRISSWHWWWKLPDLQRVTPDCWCQQFIYGCTVTHWLIFHSKVKQLITACTVYAWMKCAWDTYLVVWFNKWNEWHTFCKCVCVMVLFSAHFSVTKVIHQYVSTCTWKWSCHIDLEETLQTCLLLTEK